MLCVSVISSRVVTLLLAQSASDGAEDISPLSNRTARSHRRIRQRQERKCVCVRVYVREGKREREGQLERERVRFTVFERERERQIKAQAKDWSETA